MNKENFTIINKLAQAIYDKKGKNILALDLRGGKSSLSDFVLIAEGNVQRHVIAIARALKRVIKETQEVIHQIDIS